jgi:hypoxanthine-DNA glycosylase
MKSNTEIHNIEPVFDANSKILILGSFPSVKSREMKFFYGHPQNRFWKVLSALFNTECPVTMEEKKQLLLSNNIALWDVIKSCDIVGSSDSSIKNAVPNDFTEIFEKADIKAVYTNGSTAYNLYKKYCKNDFEAIRLPSTSPANAAYSLDKLINEWKIIR